jgi:hypothetical protein
MPKANESAALEAQIRECFGRVIYTHKTHSKMADRKATTLRRLKLAQIALSSLTASGAVSIIFSDQFSLKLATALISFGAVTLTAYMKGFDPGAEAQKHRDAAADIWPIRESYLSLLADIVSGDQELDKLRERRDTLQSSLAAIHKGAPHTDGDAYADAQVALKKNEEYTFSDDEIDSFLPSHLRKRDRQGKPANP